MKTIDRNWANDFKSYSILDRQQFICRGGASYPLLTISDKLRKAQSCQEDKEKMSNCY
jgi:hypothetical protein